MKLRSRPLNLTIRARRAGDGSVITLYRTPEGRRQGLTPVGRVEVSFSRPSGLSGADPSQITLTIQQPAGAPALALGYDDRIEVEAAFPDQPDWPIRICTGWVLSWTRTVTGTIATYTVQCQDIIGRIAGWMVGDTPWPQSQITARARRINTLAGETIADWPNDYRTVAPRDVDNRSILELLTLLLEPVETLAGFEGQVIRVPPPGLIWQGNSMTGEAPLEVPTRAVVDRGLAMTRAGRLTRVTVKAPPPNGGEPVVTTYASAARGPSTQLSYESDMWGASAWLLRSVLEVAAMTEAQLQPTELLTSRLDLDTLRTLLSEIRLFGSVYLDGPLSNESIYRTHLIVGGTITVQGGELVSYAITLAPSTTGGLIRVRWRDLPLIFTYGRTTFGYPIHDGPQPDSSPTWRKTRAVRPVKEN